MSTGEDAPHGGAKTSTLYIWGLDKSIDQPTIKEEFAKYIKIKRVTIIKDKASGTSKGFGYVECETADDATKAMKEMDGRVIGENPVRIKYSFSETPDWLKALESRGELREGAESGGRGGGGGFRGRGGPNGRGRGVPDGRGRGYDMRGNDGPDFRGRGAPVRGRPHDFNRGSGRGNGPRYEDRERVLPPRMVDDYPGDQLHSRRPPRDYYLAPYERRPVEDTYDRQPRDGNVYERRPYDDVYGRRSVDNPYERPRPLDEPYERQSFGSYERRVTSPPYSAPSSNAPGVRTGEGEIFNERAPTRRSLVADDPHANRGRDAGYEAADRRDIYRGREDLYRSSDRENNLEHVPNREEYRRGNSTAPSEELHYRARSPIDRSRSAPGRDHYDREILERPPASLPARGPPERRIPEVPPASTDYRLYDKYASDRTPQPSYPDDRYSDAKYGTVVDSGRSQTTYERSQEPVGRSLTSYEGSYGGGAIPRSRGIPEKVAPVYDRVPVRRETEYDGYADMYGPAGQVAARQSAN